MTQREKLLQAVDRQLRKETAARNRKLQTSEEWIQFQKDWNRRIHHVCKPCWELKYCPYGPLVEQFPLPPVVRKAAIEHNEFAKGTLKKQAYKGDRKKLFEYEVKTFRPTDYLQKIPKEINEKACKIFGHICPVFFVNEPLTETTEERRITRIIPRDVMLRVVRRDNYTCQECPSSSNRK